MTEKMKDFLNEGMPGKFFDFFLLPAIRAKIFTDVSATVQAGGHVWNYEVKLFICSLWIYSFSGLFNI